MIFNKIKLLKFSGLLLAAVSAAQAQLYTAVGAQTGVRTDFTFAINPTTDLVSVFVSNLVAGPGGVTGTLTSFGFNVPDNLISSAQLTSAPAGWTLAVPYDLNAGGNIFVQEVGAATGGNPNGGDPQTGIAFGGTGTFVFSFSNFTNATGFLGANGVTGRWQEVTVNPKSDEGFGNPGTPGGPIVPVPEPSTYGLIGAAILTAGVYLRRRVAAVRQLG